MLVTPLVRYDSIKIGTVDVALSSNGRISFNPPFNRIDIEFTPTNCSLSYYEVRITEETAECNIGVGNLAYWNSNLALNTKYSFSIPVTKDAGTHSSLFPTENITYRVSLYAKSSVDGSWDVVQLLFVVQDTEFVLSDGSGFGVLTTEAAPEPASQD